MSKKKAHFLYLIDHGDGNDEMKLMTEAEAAHYSLIHEREVWNVHSALDMDPEMLDTKIL